MMLMVYNKKKFYLKKNKRFIINIKWYINDYLIKNNLDIIFFFKEKILNSTFYIYFSVKV